jgi:PPOX class probable F420-dependent enzyme
VYSVLDQKPKRAAPEQLRRVRNILTNPQVQVLVDEYDEDWSCLRFVQLRGRADLLRTGVEHSRAIWLLRQKYAQYASMAIEGRPVLRVRVEQVVAWRA